MKYPNSVNASSLAVMLTDTSQMAEETKIDNLYDYIDLIRERTAMYVGENTLSALYFHINGYNMACSLKGIEENLQPEFHLFHRHYKWSPTACGNL